MTRPLEESVTLGHRRINGTDWPIEARVRRNGTREWIAEIICNGVNDWAESHRTLVAARQAVSTRAFAHILHPEVGA